jgi:hypothetical protein
VPDLPGQPSEVVSGRPVYERAFVRHCHQLLASGYKELQPTAFQHQEEPAITGELVRAMKCVQQRRDAPRWMIYLHIADDPPVNSPGRLGKRRRRVDIEFERPLRGRRPRFQCEAKRLYQTDSIAKYLGSDGLGRFLVGDYSRADDAAGMLGYVQTRGCIEWSSDLRVALEEGRLPFEIASSEPFAEVNLDAKPLATWRSEHHRTAVGHPIAIYHSLLLFLSE